MLEVEDKGGAGMGDKGRIYIFMFKRMYKSLYIQVCKSKYGKKYGSILEDIIYTLLWYEI